MSEEKKPKVDRFYVERKDFDMFNSLKEKGSPFVGARNKEIFLAAMVVGYHERCSIELKTREGYFHEEDLTREEAALIRAIAVAEEEGLSVLLDKQRVYSIAEQFASGGISLLKANVTSGEYGSYAKKLESELLRAYEKIQKTAPKNAKIQDTTEPLALIDLINKGESETLEFKSSMVWDSRKNQPNRELKIVVAKELAAFMNTNGGILLIGVEDDKTITGVDKDLAILHNSADDFELTLTNLVNTYLGKMNKTYVDLKFDAVNDKQIAVVRVKKSQHPVYVKVEGRKEEFCIRPGNSCQTLEVSEASQYIKENWPDSR
jgi:Skp family chaperone for outer membrane proteins